MQAMMALVTGIALALGLFPAFAEDEATGSELADLLGSGSRQAFEKALTPRRFEFPRDHGPHPEYRNEWWYVTGNLDGADGRRFGFELTFFRFALTPSPPADDSGWRTNQVYIAHFAVTDVEAGRFHVDERFSRGAVGLAGAGANPFRVWIDDWQLADRDGGGWRLAAASDEVRLELKLDALKPPVLNGIGGLSQKSEEAGNASYYYSVTRFRTVGDLTIGDETFAVAGLSWLDREWSSSALAPDQEGWDWFALQLSDGSDFMFYNLRRSGGAQDEHSAGTWVSPDGAAFHLAPDDVAITVTDDWESPEGGRYPSGWIIRVPSRQLVLELEPVLDDQELFTTVRYWEGAVDVRGERGGAPIHGRGYVELTGYADDGVLQRANAP